MLKVILCLMTSRLKQGTSMICPKQLNHSVIAAQYTTTELQSYYCNYHLFLINDDHVILKIDAITPAFIPRKRKEARFSLTLVGQVQYYNQPVIENIQDFEYNFLL